MGLGRWVWEWGCRRPYFVIFVSWGAVIVDGGDSMGLSRKSYLGQGKISRFPWVQDFLAWPHYFIFIIIISLFEFG